jgi:type I restriction enzyme S subunit
VICWQNWVHPEMTPDRLLAHYERIADAPGAVSRLRRFVLDLAVRGKLVPQDVKDEPALQLLERLNRGRKHKRKFAEIDESELENPLPALPPNWMWVPADQISADEENAITDGPFGSQLKADHYISEPGFRVIRLQNIGSGFFREEHRSYIDQARFERLAKHHVNAGDLIVAGLVDPKVRCCEVPCNIGPTLVKADCYRFMVHPKLSSRFVLYFLNSPLAQQFAAVHNHGMTLTRIGLGNFRRIPIALPPLAEQHRIAAEVYELMALCDRLVAARAEQETARDRLAAASLARLNVPDPDTFQDDARFALNALPALTTRPDQIKQLRQTILNLAVRGMLVPQDANDEPASKLLKRIGAASTLANHEADYHLESGWEWALIEDCFTVSSGMQKTPARTPKANAFPYLGVGNVYRGRLELATVKKFELGEGELEKFRLEPSDILVVEGNGSASEVGRCAVWHGEINNCVHQNQLIRCRPKELLLTPYAALYMNSPDGTAEMQRLAITSAGLFSLSVGKIRKIAFPLPPLSEQHRIVAKVDELMALCDRLEASLTATDTTRRRLLDALLAEALAPANIHNLEAA